MGRIAANQLKIEPLENGHFCLSGYYSGKRIRKRSRNLSELQKKKEELDKNSAQTKEGPVLRATWLTEEDLRRFEAQRFAEMTNGSAHQAKAIKWDDAIDVWSMFLLNELKRFPRTVTKNRARLLAFRCTLAGQYVHEATQEEFERHILRQGVTAQTQFTDGGVIRTFFKFAARSTKRWVIKSPVSEEIMSDLAKRAKSTKRPRILTPEQAQRLLTAANEFAGGKLVPYVLLATWCFMRHAEVLRVDPADLILTPGHAMLQIQPRKFGTPSSRDITIPENALKMLVDCFERELMTKGKRIYYSQVGFNTVREKAGLITREKVPSESGHLGIVESHWQEHILRHTGISYLYQKTGDIKQVVRQAGNSSSTAFKHYLNLPTPGAQEKFYAATV